MDVKEEAVCEDREERGEPFDGMNKRNRYLRGSCRRKYMSTKLEEGQRKGCFNYIPGRISDPVFQSWNCDTEGRIYVSQVGEENTPGGDEGELNQCQCDRLRKGVEDGFGGSIRQCGAEIPDKTESLRIIRYVIRISQLFG